MKLSSGQLSLSAHYSIGEEEPFVPDDVKPLSVEEFHQRYELGDVLGRGSYSTVRVARSKSHGGLFACKIIHKHKVDEPSRIRQEVHILKHIEHEHIVRLYDTFETKDELLLITDVALGGELFDRIIKRGRFAEWEAVRVIGSILGVLEHLHSNDVIHRDIKPENILLMSPESNVDIKLSDFGLATMMNGRGVIQTGNSTLFAPMDHVHSNNNNGNNNGGRSNDMGRARAYTQAGSDYYIAPEILLGDGYDQKVDIWSVGVVLFILLSGEPPFHAQHGEHISTMYTKILSGQFTFQSPKWDDVSPQAKDLIMKLLTVDPSKRLDAKQALQHPWFSVQQ